MHFGKWSSPGDVDARGRKGKEAAGVVGLQKDDLRGVWPRLSEVHKLLQAQQAHAPALGGTRDKDCHE